MPGPWLALPLAAVLLCAGCSLLPWGSRHAVVNGTRIAYRVHGHGPKLLLLHGGGSQSLALARQILDFGKHYTVIAPDQRGHGGTQDDGDTLSYHRMAEDMVALLDVLHAGRVNVMGWSDGAIVGLDLAIHHPGRVRKLVLFGANFTPQGVDPAVLASLQRAWVEDSTARAADVTEPLPFDARLRRLWLTQPHYTPAQLRSIECPTLVAVGDHDLPRLEHTLELARTIPGAQLCIIPGATHAVLYERADIADEIVIQFLKAPIRPAGGSTQM
jgi:pimeloyl-ACP methyl ester carboxylesterase